MEEIHLFFADDGAIQSVKGLEDSTQHRVGTSEIDALFIVCRHCWTRMKPRDFTCTLATGRAQGCHYCNVGHSARDYTRTIYDIYIFDV